MRKWRRKKTQSNRITDEKWYIIQNTNEIQRIIRKYLQNLCSSKLENIDEMYKFLEAYNQPKLNQEDINHLNRSITNNGIEGIITFSLQRRVHNLMDSWPNFTNFKEELIPMLLKIFQEREREGALPNSFYEASMHSTQ
jgi:hypothetical protein